MTLAVEGLQNKIYLFVLVLTVICCSRCSVSFAAHPLITDDTGTQGKGNSQLEVNGEYSYDKEREEGVTIKETGSELAAAFSYGMLENLDVVVGLPYQWNKTREDGKVVSDENGISDMSLEMKWMFYEKDGLSFALKPGLTLPTGDDEKGLGAGRTTFSVFLISTKEVSPFAVHVNIGYIRNENKAEDRKDIWHASVTGESEVVKNLKLVANIGAERNPDRTSNTHPAFVLGGVIYSITENFDIDFGVKAGLNKPEMDYSILSGIAWRI